ncbi:crotonase/enoyl-CoA hydratase family protein [Nonomuraea turkmeniaca]|uniref:Crotonase/enoyl-CoA hydratase family protein n=1 Tax=Nonomuraea turkmeniaca TaxID=103838 RepID=A0A5S4EUL5_9ACTN|nr:crotonase/enoyl-CoA hydratase family protein [Nonomuraea turkmeniaca]TMR05507.1 crotonase/enoyl-CoA hydratase family protein [Nonomuraea turkmeniaca]
MGTLVSCRLKDSVATITMDDGKVNAISLQMVTELNAALDQAAAGSAVVLLGGREGVLSAGFDLGTLRAGGGEAVELVRGGFELAARLLSFPAPVVIACTGHAVAMGAFLLLSGDYRVGAAGPYRLAANEVAIGITMPYAAVEILRQRLIPAVFTRAVTLAEVFSPDDAVAAGFLDRVVEPARMWDAARATAESLTGLDMAAHAASKLRARRHMLEAVRAGIAEEFGAATTAL